MTKTLQLTLLIAIAIPIFVIVFYSQPVLLLRPRSEIPLDSPLVTQLKQDTKGTFRFAVVGLLGERLLPPNQPALLGLRSIHSYNSLSSRYYQHYVKRLSAEGATEYGRHFVHLDISQGLHEKELLQAGVNVLLASSHIQSDVYKPAHVINGVHILKSNKDPWTSAIFEDFEKVSDGAANVSFESRHSKIVAETRFDDVLTFRFHPSEKERLLFVSQQHHPQWIAYGENSIPLPLVRANDFFLAVLIPPGHGKVTLEFRPFVLWSWIPQLLYGIAFSIILVLKGRDWIWRFVRQRQSKVSLFPPVAWR